MSRTFRRKNYEAENRTSWDNQGTKLAGVYTERDYIIDGRIRWVYREPTEQEYHKAYYNYHSDRQSRYVRKGPNKWYRKEKMHEHRMLDKSELRKFMKDDNYEPMCWNRVADGYWD